MSVIYCQICDRYIDLDWNVEHEEDCAWEHGVEDPPEPYTRTELVVDEHGN